ncbi:hypothetical protein WN51_05027 [Melipona quadrifasciata]|uniref:Uncharacterized protein n=1 Tax=Melipona quadrifasciata TaxID=166423 RepID=A0A0N0BD01_9HYME|nr:hypothetical protein WN51_05027 [Melipona quadrifasciata]
MLQSFKGIFFWDIPSAWWQASTVAMGIGVAIAVIGALTLLAAASSFLPHILKTPKHTRALGSLQLLAALLFMFSFITQIVVVENIGVTQVLLLDVPTTTELCIRDVDVAATSLKSFIVPGTRDRRTAHVLSRLALASSVAAHRSAINIIRNNSFNAVKYKNNGITLNIYLQQCIFEYSSDL